MDKVGWKGNSCFRKLIAVTSQDILLQRFLFFGLGGHWWQKDLSFETFSLGQKSEFKTLILSSLMRQ